jgi:hypothetical protein
VCWAPGVCHPAVQCDGPSCCAVCDVLCAGLQVCAILRDFVGAEESFRLCSQVADGEGPRAQATYCLGTALQAQVGAPQHLTSTGYQYEVLIPM